MTRTRSEPDPAGAARVARVRRASPWLAGLSALVALLTLLFGWGLGFDAFRRLDPGFPAMVPTTATAILAGGIGTVLGWWRPAHRGLLLCAALIVATVLVSWIGSDPRPERRDAMSLGTVTACLLLAAALMARQLCRGALPVHGAIETLGLAVTAVPLLGYLFNAEALFANPVYTEMALHTAFCLLALFIALLLLTPEAGWLGVLTADGRGSQMARWLLPLIVLGPVALCFTALQAVRLNLLTPDLRVAVLTFAMIFLIAAGTLFFAHLTNLTEQRAHAADARLLESERARQVSELAAARAQKVEALGQLVGGVAHDFNNSLTVIIGNLELIEDDPDPGRRKDYVQEAMTASNHAAQLTRQLLAYGRKSRLEPLPNVLDDIIGPALSMFRRVCPSSIDLTTDLKSQRAIVEVDVANFQQALLNVLINARDAQPDGGAIFVHTSVGELSGELAEGFGGTEKMRPGRYVSVTVRDTGPGLTAEELGHATEPFFTTKPPGEGTGLGLSVAAGFCRQSGGGLILTSEPGEGLSVTMAFPVVALTNELERAQARRVERGELPTPRSILVVDDEANVTRVIARQLQLDGHQVRIALSGDQALTVLSAGPLPDLVISDVEMPGALQGHALAEVIRARFPQVKVFLMSGYESARRRLSTTDLEDVPFLQKPIDRVVLRRAVAEALGEAESDPPEDG